MGGISDTVCFERKNDAGSTEPLWLRAGTVARDTCEKEADNWSKAGEQFALLNPAASFSEEAEIQVVSRCSRTATTIVSLCYTPPAPIAIIERSHRFPNASLWSLPGSYISGGPVTFHTCLNFTDGEH